MNKISNIFLLIVLSISLNQIHAGKSKIPCELQTNPEFDATANSFNNLDKFIENEDLDTIKYLISETKERKPSKFTNESILYHVLINFLIKPSDFKLKVIEYLIQNGIDLNNTYFDITLDKLSPLEYIIYTIRTSIYKPEMLQLYGKLINLLLGYGVNITEKAINFTKTNQYNIELFKILNHHQDIINQAQTNPTGNLLLEAIEYNKPYVVKLIVDSKPELIRRKHLELAESNSPYSLEILKQALPEAAIQKFEESELVQAKLPWEIIQRIEKFAGFEK